MFMQCFLKMIHFEYSIDICSNRLSWGSLETVPTTGHGGAERVSFIIWPRLSGVNTSSRWGLLWHYICYSAV